MSGILQGLLASFSARLAQELYAWGVNDFGQLGLGNRVDRSSPVQVGALANWAQVIGSSQSSGAIKTDGTMWTWGDNFRGGLGINISGYANNRSSPVQVGALTTWSLISMGRWNGHAIKTDGTLWGWGDGAIIGANIGGYGNNRSSPVQVGSSTDWATVSCNFQNVLAITTSGELYVWGNNGQGYVGDNTTISRSSPVQVGALTNWALGVTATGGATVVKTDGTLWSWGRGTEGQNGDNAIINRSSPVQIGALTTWFYPAKGNSGGCIKTNGTLWTWGPGSAGALGTNTLINCSSPVQVGALTNWAVIKMLNNASGAIKTDGTLWTWGSNNNGAIGDDTNVGKSSPVQIGALTDWVDLTVGQYSKLAIRRA